jgi:NADPH2 dehydrogenase
MARFFKFHSTADLMAESHRLGLDLRLSDDFTPLFRPVQFGPLRAGNALCVQPMEGCDGTLDGRPDSLTVRRWERFGAGGAKLIWGEAAAVSDDGRANSRQLLVADHTVGDLEKLHLACRNAHHAAFGSDSDLVVGLQLTHSGRYSFRKPLIAMHDPLLDPRTIVDKAVGTTVDASYPLLTDDDLKQLVDRYLAAAKLAWKAGFQFIDIKQCHRYLLNELLAAHTRPGPYGGSFENRTRLAREIIQGIRSELPEMVLASRLNVFDSIPYRMKAGAAEGEPCPHATPLTSCWGTSPNDHTVPDLTEPIAWIREMAKLGVALVNVSMGNPYGSPHIIRPFEYPPPDGYETPEHPLIGVDRHFRLAGEIQAAIPEMPIVGSGYSYLQEFLPHAGAANLRDGRCRFVGVGRATLSQPDFAKQLMDHGRLDRKRICRTFSYCTALMRSKHNELGQFAAGCPPFDKDAYGDLWEAAKKKGARQK